jgi:hypothetical protein
VNRFCSMRLGISSAAETVQDVKSQPGNTVTVVIGHTDSVPQIIQGLVGGAGEDVKIEDWEFDKLFVLFIPSAGRATLLKLRYGAATLPCTTP